MSIDYKSLSKYISQYNLSDKDYKITTFEDHEELINELHTYIYYKNESFLHRFDGPAEIHKYKIFEENETKEIIEKQWLINNKLIPFWVPKIEDGLIYGKVDKRICCEVIMKYDREYGAFLNKTYSNMKENKSNMQKEFQEHILSMIKFYKEVSFDNINDAIFNTLGVISVSADSNIEKPKEVEKILKVIEENVFDMVINKTVLYNEESKIISIAN